MCGIAGVFHYGDPSRPVDVAALERMTRALAHRGPDGEGFHVDGPIGLGHRRLAIVDLTPSGAQPMASEDGACWLSYNGEFYDHARHRADLAARHQFRGRSDTETLLHLLEEQGPAALGDLSAIFGLAFWDGRRRRLTLARDPLGVKQVYFHDDGRRVVFASEIKALLLAEGVERSIDPEAVNEYLHFHTPLFARTFFRGIRQVLPGEAVEWQLGGGRSARRFWQVTDFSELEESPEEMVEELRRKLALVVKDQLMSDVPVGAFFSGGIDSSAVAKFAKRAGQPPRCFGVHFSGQGVIDERPYQEQAAKALGLELELMTLDGSTFADDLPRLIWQQDQPVIGSAMIPMFHVSRLASRQVKVCLGGQAADEIFGGYARYSLAHPLRAGLSLLGRSRGGEVGGNLRSQLGERRTLGRLLRGASHLLDWRDLYFSNFAKVPEATWRGLIDDHELISRESCWITFRETVARSRATDPAAKAMHWDLQTYLPGLFQQDDRMSMASSLESRVPLADPRLVAFAFRVPFNLKVRDGASKWLLRRAVADVLPPEVLNRRKVGFDTPIEQWMRGRHAGFVREVLLSRPARERGLWNARTMEAWLDHPDRQNWADVIWKALCVELWAQQVLDAAPGRPATAAAVRLLAPTPAPAPPPTPGAEPAGQEPITLADRVQELRELGPSGIAFRVRWEGGMRSGLVSLAEREPRPLAPSAVPSLAEVLAKLPFDAAGVERAVNGAIPCEARERLDHVAQSAARGRILAFGRWFADYGLPPDWHLNPVTGRRWSSHLHWSKVYAEERRAGDIKLAWEIGRFPHAYHLARAAALQPASQGYLQQALADQVRRFADDNPYGRGIHWASGQEIAFRLMAWLFALGAGGPTSPLAGAFDALAASLYAGARHVERHLDYTLRAVYNNHLLSEALLLYLAGELLPAAPEAARWRARGLEILTGQATRQFYPDGGYIQLSHNYERVALQVYLWAVAVRRKLGGAVPPAWLEVLARGSAFLDAHLNPADGRLPNYGSNDGALPSILSTCDYADFRPTLQAASLAARGERLYPPGPWDEEAAWLLGPASLAAPLRRAPRGSSTFEPSGFHVLRGRDQGSFAAFRCGSVRDRFSQIDMLHLDVWWRGQNVLVDGGSYLYNGPQHWHDHFMRTESHNTVTVDGHDQMLHYRRFKALYWTQARLLRFEDHPGHALVEGEHTGFARHPGGCVHRRAVLFVKDGLWVVVDQVGGAGEHQARLQWLCGDFPERFDAGRADLTLQTPAGPFHLALRDESGRPVTADVVRGRSNPPRGWQSRYYAEKRPVPSLATTTQGPLPTTLVSLLSAGPATATVEAGRWTVAGGEVGVSFRLVDGRFTEVALTPAAGPAP